MAVEDVIKLVKEVATEVIPDNITFTDVKVESSNVVLYTPNLEMFSENNEVIRTLAQKVRKRIIIKADPSVRKPIISAKQKLLEVLPEEAEVVDVKFDEINGDVIIEAVNPGRAIGKHGAVLNQVRREIGWNPIVIRSAPMESKTL
ncbi:MAG TPA: beta-CASP ribonuclease aCPSF1, partial [Candidatus Poseidoniales archaeon]|nr:beta-CASP ribonuclease aCPSF1 [Candidatus Poseidoniales archaeon]